jgi:FAD/FMN-containing dehydrogenase
MQSRELRVLGGLYESRAPVVLANSRGEVQSAFEHAAQAGQRVTVAGAKRSFGEHYLPPDGGVVLDVAELDRGATLLSEEDDGSLWVRAGGGTTFRDLRRLFPEHRTYCPPTADRISLAGALATCTHNSAGYFADSVRAFSLICPSGVTHHCSRDAAGLPGKLFEHVPGSLGALGVTTDIELRLSPIARDQQVLVHAVYAGRSDSGAYLGYLEQVADDPRYSEGAGAVVYGNRGHAIVFGDELLAPGQRHRGPRALLTDEAIGQQALTQTLVNRLPRLAEWIVSRAYRQGIARWAPWYGFQFYQRSFDEAHLRMAKRGLGARILRLFGVRDRMPVCHMSWFFPRAELRAFASAYFDMLGRYPGLEHWGEQQDFVLLGPSQWPCHSMGRTSAGVGVFTASFGVERDGESQRRTVEFFREFTAVCVRSIPGTRVSLCKQIHANTADLRSMHADFVQAVRALRLEVDPKGILTSRLLQSLGLP